MVRLLLKMCCLACVCVRAHATQLAVTESRNNKAGRWKNNDWQHYVVVLQANTSDAFKHLIVMLIVGAITSESLILSGSPICFSWFERFDSSAQHAG